MDGNSLARFGVLLRYQDPQNYYLVSRKTGGTSVVQISKVVGGSETVLASTSVPNPALNAFFRLEGRANGATLTLKLDGVQKLSVVDSTFSSGNVGIGLGSMSATPIGQAHRADNFAAIRGVTAVLRRSRRAEGSRAYSGSPFRRYMAWMMFVARVMEPNHFS